jgi:hypothetical protein
MYLDPLIIDSYSSTDKLQETTYYLYDNYTLIGSRSSKRINNIYLPESIKRGEYIAYCDDVKIYPEGILA